MIDLSNLLRAHSIEGIFDALREILRVRVNAIDVLVWHTRGDGRYQLEGSSAPSLSLQELGVAALPSIGKSRESMVSWPILSDFFSIAMDPIERDRRVLAIRFSSPPPASLLHDRELQTVAMVASLALDRIALEGGIVRARTEAIARAGAGLAHTLGNVLQAALSSVELGRTMVSSDARAVLGEASTSLKRASTIVTQLAALGGSRAKVQVTDVCALVTGLVAALEAQMPAGVEFRIQQVTGDRWAALDAVTFGAALASLVYMAREELGAFGQIRMYVVGSMLGGQKAVAVHLEWSSAPESGVTITETDSDDRRSFADPGGTDGETFPITMAAAAVAPFGGTLEVCRSSRRRACIVRVPDSAAPGRGSAPMKTVDPSARATAALTVLVADDEPAVLRGIQRILTASGHRVFAARDGIEAVAVISKVPGVDVALIDLTMPRLAGPALLVELRRIAPRLPVVVMTGYASDDAIEAIEREGTSAVLKKPVDSRVILEALGKAVGHAS